MKYTAKGIQISLITHGIFFALLFYLGTFMVPEKKTVLIDMTLSEPMVSEEGELAAKTTGLRKTETGKEIKVRHSPAKFIMTGQKPSSQTSASEYVSKISSAASETPIIESQNQARSPLLEAGLVSESESSAGSGAYFQDGEDTGASTPEGRSSGFQDGGKAGIHSSGKGTGEAGTKNSSGEGDGMEIAKKRYLREHYTYIWDMIKKNLTYPLMACKMGWEGKVVVFFTVSENGSMENIKVLETSGYSLLDKCAVETVRKSAPFPKPPVRAELVIPVVYKLQSETQ